jgi:hypothetical protein
MVSKDDSFLGELAVCLRGANLDAVVVGNTASILSGAPVLTQDVDLLVRDTPANRKKLKRLAALLHATGPVLLSDLADVERIYGTRVPIDILYDRLPGKLAFASVRSRARFEPAGGDMLLVACLADVIASKVAAGRAKDKAALPILRSTLAARRALGLDK